MLASVLADNDSFVWNYGYQLDPITGVFSLAVAVLTIAGQWAVFNKAGLHGWAAIVPFYNLWTLCKTAGRPGWWFIWLILPIANIIVGIIIAVEVARRFGRGGAFGFFLLFWPLPFIGYPILGFGSAQYQGAPYQGEGAGQVRI
ncbi:DUF5684 domain-containing protein [Herbiconiux sp. KACC 21604]|uniref:DUF5684 domain-containing protein n=1 Tax=unclassified Herbiconiux TaxID=2618217 RepID=UPI001C11666F|nr:DUF5684 domain-containing protein [Herbiconiux sp. SALV-R1]WPO87180.1 DUF5684 domain-containing protein [Herbiconiux sp. KACC 21604]